METGVVLGYGKNLAEDFAWCAKHSIPTCQLGVGVNHLTQETSDEIKQLCKTHNMRITALVGSWTGPSQWNFTGGPATLGIVPIAFRAMRMKELEACARFAQMLGVKDVCTHLGFIPENPGEGSYADFIASLKHLVAYYKAHDTNLNMETGQETPVTLLRVINDIGATNLGINFDPANLLMYGKANPIDALSIIGPYINGVHAKDGQYPTDGINLGEEKPLGEGQVNIKQFVLKLHEVGYKGALTIEREISGEQQRIDVIKANQMLRDIISENKLSAQ